MLKDDTVIRVVKRQVGKIRGDTLVAFHRQAQDHLFRGGKRTIAEAVWCNTAAWGFDAEMLATLYEDHGIRFIELPSSLGVYRVKIETFLNHGFVHEYGDHRPQLMLNLKHWIRTGEPDDTTSTDS